MSSKFKHRSWSSGLGVALFLIVAGISTCWGAPPTAVIDTQTPGLWTSVPFELLPTGAYVDPAMGKTDRRQDWIRPGVTLEDLKAGVQWSKEHSQDQQNTLLWRDHHRYPTIATQQVPKDWSSYGSLVISCWSDKATGELITVGVLADNPSTAHLDYWLQDLRVDWTGWKTLDLPLAKFEKLGKPTDWQNVTGLFFFTKARRQWPNPQTVLYIKNIQLEGTAAVTPLDASTPSYITEGIYYDTLSAVGYDAPVELNHTYPEVITNLEPSKSLVEQYYFQGARALHGYFPRYDPGFVTFDPKGQPCIRGLDRLNIMTPSGQWQRVDLTPAIRDFCRANKWVGFSIGDRNGQDIRFDAQGDAYAIVNLTRRDAAGKETDWHDRSVLLLHAHGLGQPFKWYKLPGRTADFEHLEAHNLDALNHPPVILQHDITYFFDTDQQGYLLVPEKLPDGTLRILPGVPIGTGKSECIVAGPVHSGGANFMLSRGEKVYVIYGSMPVPGPQGPGSSLRFGKPEDEEGWRKSLNIPQDHPANSITWAAGHTGPKGQRVASSTGVPAFIRVYDRSTGKISDPVFVGYGGKTLDGHNWPAMTMDSKGNIHVILNGHIDPFIYIHTLTPGDVEHWSKPALLTRAPGETEMTQGSYPALSCDRDDNLILVFRDDTTSYNHRLGMISKPAGSEAWTADRSVVVPPTYRYHCWAHKLGYDRLKNRFFLTLYERNDQCQLFRDEYYFCRFLWPFTDLAMTRSLSNPGSDNGGPPPEGKYAMFTTGAGEATVLVTDDLGRNWRLATTPDLVPHR